MRETKDTFLKIKKSYLGMGLKSIDILILSQIEEFQRNGCTCYMTNKQFSDMFGESESTVKRSIDKLENLNIVSRETKTITGNGQSSKQRIMTVCGVSLWKVKTKQFPEESKGQKSIKQGSKNDEAKVKNKETTVHNELIKDNLKENIKYNSKKGQESSKESSYKSIKDLSYNEGDDICARLKKGEKYIDIARLYNLQVVTKDFPQQWADEKKHRYYAAEAQRAAEEWAKMPKINYDSIAEMADKGRRSEESQIDISSMLDEVFYTEEELSVRVPQEKNSRRRDLSDIIDDIYIPPDEYVYDLSLEPIFDQIKDSMCSTTDSIVEHESNVWEDTCDWNDYNDKTDCIPESLRILADLEKFKKENACMSEQSIIRQFFCSTEN